MDYQKHYDLLIDRAKNRKVAGYSEKHHIVPKCMGGNNDYSNLVNLTPEEHYIAHLLLIKIFPKESKLLFAANRMISDNGHQNRSKNKMHGWLRRKLSEHMAKKMREVNTGRKQSPEHIKKRADARRGKSTSLKGSKIPKEKRMNNKRCKSVLCVETKEIFYSARDAERKYGAGVRNAAAGFQKTCGGYHWEYVSKSKLKNCHRVD